jgi:molybdopterin-binding protein
VVREILKLPDRTFVAIDVGQFLWAQVTPEAAQEMGLEPGQQVTCLLKTSSLTLLPCSQRPSMDGPVRF